VFSKKKLSQNILKDEDIKKLQQSDIYKIYVQGGGGVVANQSTDGN
jgi:hypothetical protein